MTIIKYTAGQFTFFLKIYDLRPDCDCFLRKDKTNIVFIEVENEKN